MLADTHTVAVVALTFVDVVVFVVVVVVFVDVATSASSMKSYMSVANHVGSVPQQVLRLMS